MRLGAQFKTQNSFSVRLSYGQHADSDVLCGQQFVAAGCDGGAGGEDVVNEEDVLAFYHLWANKAEGALHVLQTLRSGEASLGGGVADAEDGGGGNGQTGHLADALGNEKTLIVAALLLPLEVERQGNDDVDVVKEAVKHELFGNNTSEQMRHVGTLAIFNKV